MVGGGPPFGCVTKEGLIQELINTLGDLPEQWWGRWEEMRAGRFFFPDSILVRLLARL